MRSVVVVVLRLSPLSVFVVMEVIVITPASGHQDLAEGPGIWIRERKTSSVLRRENSA